MILLIDNYDSFTYNLLDYLQQLGCAVQSIKNDEWTIDTVISKHPDAIILSPGPGRPEGAGITLELIKAVQGTIPLLGICLGHQAIALAFGGTILQAPAPVHGKTSWIEHDNKTIFTGLPKLLQVTRYHSLMVQQARFPDACEISASTEDGIIMGLRHKYYPIEGVQFHPEAILTQSGMQLLKQFVVLYTNIL